MKRDVLFVGNRIKTLREKNSITATALADGLQVSKEIIKDYEDGIIEPDLRNFALMSHFLKVPMEYFIEIIESPDQNDFTKKHKERRRGDFKLSPIKRAAHPLDRSVADLSLDVLHLSTRTRNALLRGKCVTVQDVCLVVESKQVLNIRYLGIVSLQELILEIFKLTGVDFRDCYPDLYFPKTEESLPHDK